MILIAHCLGFKKKPSAIQFYSKDLLEPQYFPYPPASAEDIKDEGSIPGSGRSPGGGKGNQL